MGHLAHDTRQTLHRASLQNRRSEHYFSMLGQLFFLFVPSIMAYTLTSYGPKSIALFGDTRAVNDSLGAKGHRGLFNRALTNPLTGDKTPGWIFKLDKKDALLQDKLLDGLEWKEANPMIIAQIEAAKTARKASV